MKKWIETNKRRLVYASLAALPLLVAGLVFNHVVDLSALDARWVYVKDDIELLGPAFAFVTVFYDYRNARSVWRMITLMIFAQLVTFGGWFALIFAGSVGLPESERLRIGTWLGTLLIGTFLTFYVVGARIVGLYGRGSTQDKVGRQRKSRRRK